MAPTSIRTLGARSFPALGRRNFRIFWIGQAVSLVGTWMQTIGQDWLVLELTGSPAKLSVVSAVQFLPLMAFSLFAGPLIDRFPKRRMLILTQSALAVLALALSVIVATHVARYWMVLVLAFLLGMVTLVDNPTRQAYMIEIAGRDVLVNAVSLNSAAFNLARIVGPAVAGIMIELVGIAPCFLLNSLSFLAVIAALRRIDAPDLSSGVRFTGFRDILRSVGDGLAYIRREPRLGRPIVLLAVVSTIAINYGVMIPAFAKISLGRSAAGYGLLMTSMGAGSFAAALVLAVRAGSGPSKARLYGGAIGLCVGIAACGLQRNYILSCVLLGVTGFFTIAFLASTNATLQLTSDDSHRGRVMSVYSLVLGGVTPVGALFVGLVSEATNPAFAMTFSGTLGLAAAALVLAGTRLGKARKGKTA